MSDSLKPAIGYGNGDTVTAKDVLLRKKVFTISAFDERAGKEQAKNIASYLEERHDIVNDALLDDLAFTLNERRTSLPWKAVVSASSIDELTSVLKDKDLEFAKTSKSPTIAFVFTGQGAQWHAMGCQLITSYPIYRMSIERSSRHLQAIGAPWDLLGMAAFTQSPEFC